DLPQAPGRLHRAGALARERGSPARGAQSPLPAGGGRRGRTRTGRVVDPRSSQARRMTSPNKRQPPGVGADALKAAAFDLSPDPAMVVAADGALVAVNEAAEALFGQGLGLLARGRFSAALPPGSALVSLLNLALEQDARVRERGLQISLFGLPPFEADG